MDEFPIPPLDSSSSASLIDDSEFSTTPTTTTTTTTTTGNTSGSGWQTVTYSKNKRNNNNNNKKLQSSSSSDPSAAKTGNNNVFLSVEQHAEDRRRRLAQERSALAEAAEIAAKSKKSTKKKKHWDDDDDDDVDDDDDDNGDGRAKNGVSERGGKKEEEENRKKKKAKKPKVTVAEAASKIDASDLAAFLVDISGSFETQQDIQLMRFADYFARGFSAVSASQFQWTKMFKESPVAKIADIPICYISEDVYKTSVDWINKKSPEALGSFVLWSLDNIFAELANQQGVHKGSKKIVQQPSSKSQVAIFVVLAMVLRRKPDSLVSLLSILSEGQKYQGQDKLPVMIWAISQTCYGDLVVGMYLWIHFLLPMLGVKSCNPQSRDLILQLLERILSAPKAQPILLNGAVRKGERLVPPSALDQLLRLTFPAPSARVKATERFEAAYPTLKELALGGSPGSKAMKQVLQQILTIAVKATSESTTELSKEGTSLFIWCLSQSSDCYKQWDKIYLDNVEASIFILRKLSDEWKVHSATLASVDDLREAVKSFRKKNEKALASGEGAGHQASIKEADKLCKVILGKSSCSNLCLKSAVFAFVAVAVGAFVISPNIDSWDLKKLSLIVTSQEFF